MEKRLFNKIIKEQMLSYGFEKTGTQDYAKEAADGITKIIVRAPDQTRGFAFGAKFKDFGKHYTNYSGKFKKICMAYDLITPLLHFAYHFDYSESDIKEAIATLMDKITPFLEGGKATIGERIDEWIFGLENERKQNDVFAYFGMPLIDPYSDSYILKQVEFYRQGGSSMMKLKEYYAHKEHYDKYEEHGCYIYIGKNYVTISYNRNSQK